MVAVKLLKIKFPRTSKFPKVKLPITDKLPRM